MKFQIVDAFTDEIFGGNPAGVVLLDEGADFPKDETMVKTAAELRYSETVFIKKLSDTHFHMRYFTPVNEVDLCGHATIGAFTALKDMGLVNDPGNYTIKTLAGDLNIELKGGSIFMEMGKAEILKTLESEEEIEKLAKVMRIQKSDIVRPVNIVSTGLPDIMLELSSLECLHSMNPDFPALAELSEHYGVTGVHAAFFSGKENETAHCRNFAPICDIDEEAATGTASGAITYHFYTKNMISVDANNTLIQGEAMGRPSKIVSTLSKNGEKIAIKIGGSGKVLASGKIYI